MIEDVIIVSHHLVNEKFIARIEKELTPTVLSDIKGRFKATSEQDKQLFFINFIYQKRYGYSYQILSNELVKDSILPIRTLLTYMLNIEIKDEKFGI